MLGLWLVDQKIIRGDDLDKALDIQVNSGGRIGDILISIGATTPYKLYQAIAKHTNLPFINLLTTDWPKQELRAQHLADYIRLRLLPIGKAEGTAVMRVATSEPFNPQVKQFCYDNYPQGVEMVVTSPFDIGRTIEQQFAHSLTDDSLFRLAEMMPERSARYRMSAVQYFITFTCIGLYALACYVDTLQTAAYTLLTAHILYLVTLGFKALVFTAGLKPIRYHKPSAPIADKDLPSFSLLIPLYKERATLPALLKALSELDYPKHKLDIKLVLEADDTDTYDAAIELSPTYNFSIIQVPPSEPRTKPKACNYALAFATGDIITIYDAEDIPAPDQLRKVASMLDAAPTDVTVIQAKLRYYNANKNLLTRWFDIEYAILFEHLLAGLERLRIPIPLGGTSNHINAERFREMGYWDPYNVTEDADLGIRFATAGFKTQMVDSTTMEEAPPAIGMWMRQRSRWIKGHVQTWLVHSRKPLKLLRTLGPHGFIGFNLFLGIPYLLYLTAPFIAILTYLWGAENLFAQTLPKWTTSLIALNLTLLIILHWIQAAWVYRREPFSWLTTLAILLFPAYWLLHIFSSFRSLWQFIFKPFYWEKTEHTGHI